MAKHTTMSITAQTWTEITDANVTSITFQNTGPWHMFVSGTTGTTAPSDFDGAIKYNSGQGELNTAMSDLFPGISAVRVWVYTGTAGSVYVSHA